MSGDGGKEVLQGRWKSRELRVQECIFVMLKVKSKSKLRASTRVVNSTGLHVIERQWRRKEKVRPYVIQLMNTVHAVQYIFGGAEIAISRAVFRDFQFC